MSVQEKSAKDEAKKAQPKKMLQDLSSLAITLHITPAAYNFLPCL